MNQFCVRVLIFGKVQRVGFRYFTRIKAKKLGLVGWVKNLPDGSVDALFQGDKEKVSEMILWCHDGPPLAEVDKVGVRGDQEGMYEEFEILK